MRNAGRRRRHALAAAGLLLASGCARPELAPPAAQIAVPADWSLAETATIEGDLDQYWRLLEDPLLTRLVEQAIAQNRDLASSIARLDQARASLRLARAAYLPTLFGNAGAARDLGDLARDGVPISLGADASWELDLFGQISGNVAAAQADLSAQGYALADLQRLIVGQVATSTISARAIAAQLAISRETLAYQEENLQIARWRNQAGLVSSLDVEQARTQRAQTAATIPALESSLAATANALSTLVGDVPGPILDEIAGSTAELPVPPTLAGLSPPAQVLRRRPDVRSAEASLIASTARIGVARTQLLPLVRLSGNIGTGPVTAGNLFDIVTGGVFASVSQLIFDGGRARAQIDRAEAGAEAALATWEQAILGALADVESAAVDRRTAEERVAINVEAVDAAANSALLARSQYESGLTDFQRLLVVENALLAARNGLVASQADRASAFVRLTQALGGGWSPAQYDFPLLADGGTADRTDP
jgi:NodT family efflux transporter outer membrane factor (OMF) lipoprotein